MILTLTGMWKPTGTRNVRVESDILRYSACTDRAAVPPGEPGQYKSPFIHDFIHLNVAMMTSNNALVPDPDKQDDLASQWWQWPILVSAPQLLY